MATDSLSRPTIDELFDLRSKTAQLLKVKPILTGFMADLSKIGSAINQLCLRWNGFAKLVDDEGGPQLLSSVLQTLSSGIEKKLNDDALAPLGDLMAKIDLALELARSYDLQAELLDAVELKHVSLSRDSSVETLAHSDQDLTDKTVAAALGLFDCRVAFADALSSMNFVPVLSIASLFEGARSACQAALSSELAAAITDGSKAKAELQVRSLPCRQRHHSKCITSHHPSNSVSAHETIRHALPCAKI